jgi:hypothetical protein
MEITMDIYIPPTAKPLDDKDSPQTILIGIQGQPGSGKTVASLTFPNPIILHFDKTDITGLIKSAAIIKDVTPYQIPFWSETFILDTLKQRKTSKGGLVDRREAFTSWLRQENAKFKSNQTIILDSWSSMQDSFDNVTFDASEKVYNTKGEENFYAPWDAKISYSLEVVELLKSFNCNVVVLFHETRERDKKTGEFLEKMQPLMQGKFMTELKRHFPYFVRQHCREPLDEKGQPRKGVDPEYLWQVKSSNDFDCKFIGQPSRPVYLPANYNSLIKV